MFGKIEKNNKTSPIGSPTDACNIAKGTIIEGTIKVDSNLRLEGIIYGSVSCGGRIVMSNTAFIQGDVICKNMISEGKVEGNIVVKEKIHLKPSAIVIGNIKYQTIQIDSGAVFNGQAVSSKAIANTPKTEVLTKNA